MERRRPRLGIRDVAADDLGAHRRRIDEQRRHLQPVSLDRTRPGAAASLREGLDEILTLQHLGVGGALYLTLRSTDVIENLNALVGCFVRNVRRWRNGRMLVRWIATGLL